MNDHVQNSEVSKDIWNSKPNILNHSKVGAKQETEPGNEFYFQSTGNIWSNIQLETPKVDSLFNQDKLNSVYYKVGDSWSPES